MQKKLRLDAMQNRTKENPAPKSRHMYIHHSSPSRDMQHIHGLPDKRYAALSSSSQPSTIRNSSTCSLPLQRPSIISELQPPLTDTPPSRPPASSDSDTPYSHRAPVHRISPFPSLKTRKTKTQTPPLPSPKPKQPKTQNQATKLTGAYPSLPPSLPLPKFPPGPLLSSPISALQAPSSSSSSFPYCPPRCLSSLGMKLFLFLAAAERRFLKKRSARMMARTRTMAPKTKITTATVPPEVGSAWRRWGCGWRCAGGMVCVFGVGVWRSGVACCVCGFGWRRGLGVDVWIRLESVVCCGGFECRSVRGRKCLVYVLLPRRSSTAYDI